MDIRKLAGRYHSPVLAEIINWHPDWEIGAEIGVAMGRTLKTVMDNCSVNMIAVDAFQYVPDSINSGVYSKMNHQENEKYVRALEQFYDGRIKVLKGLTWEMADEVKNDSLDFVFIDACHIYEEVKKDIKAWAPKVKKYGWIMGHDYSKRWPGVRKAVDEVLGKPLEMMETIWVHRRK